MNIEVTHFTQPIILMKRDLFLDEIGCSIIKKNDKIKLDTC